MCLCYSSLVDHVHPAFKFRNHAHWFALLLIAAAASLLAQAPGDRDDAGVYSPGDGILSPKFVQAIPVELPQDTALLRERHVCVIEVVVGIDGKASNFRLLSPPSALDNFAAAAIAKSQLIPGLRKKKPVPVRLTVIVPFTNDHPVAALQSDLIAEKRLQVPRVTHSEDVELTEDALRHGIQGDVSVRLIVSEKGIPENIQLVNKLGYGLDQSVLQAISQYKFKPATMDGVPFAFPTTIEVNFQARREN